MASSKQKSTAFRAPSWNGYSALVCLTLAAILALIIADYIYEHGLVPPNSADIITPLILGCASLIVSLSSRNASISERARSNAKLLLEEITHDRRENLNDQNEIFMERYTFNQVALCLQFLSLAIFLGMAIFEASQHLVVAHHLFFTGSGALIAGFVMTFFDIYRSQRTLLLETDYAKNFKSNTQANPSGEHDAPSNGG
jgi:hypothetical protein